MYLTQTILNIWNINGEYIIEVKVEIYSVVFAKRKIVCLTIISPILDWTSQDTKQMWCFNFCHVSDLKSNKGHLLQIITNLCISSGQNSIKISVCGLEIRCKTFLFSTTQGLKYRIYISNLWWISMLVDHGFRCTYLQVLWLLEFELEHIKCSHFKFNWNVNGKCRSLTIGPLPIFTFCFISPVQYF